MDEDTASASPPAPAATDFRDLGIPCIVNIFSRLSPKQVAAAACVSSLWHQVAGDDVLWRTFLASDFAASSACKPDGSDADSFKSAYSAWQLTYADVAGPMLCRALAAWSKVKTWLTQHSPAILASLNPGASAAEVAATEKVLGHPLPLAMRCIYRVHNGQKLVTEQQSCEEGPPPDLLMGLFGTTCFYDHITSTSMVDLTAMAKLTRLLRTMRPMGAGQTLLSSSEVIFAHSFRVADKLCAVDCNTGSVTLKLPNRDWPMAPPTDSFPQAYDGFLRWFEEYASRLSAGVYGTCAGEAVLRDSGLQEGQAISLYPQAHPYAASAITRGVQVTWSSVLVPQESRQGRLMFAYRVKYSLLTPEQQQAAALQLQAQEAAWQQRQQQEQQEQESGAEEGNATAGGGSGGGAASTSAAAAPAGVVDAAASTAAAAAAATATTTSAAAAKTFRQSVVLGSCAASAGPAAVPPALAAASTGVGGITSSTAAGAGAGPSTAGGASGAASGGGSGGGVGGDNSSSTTPSSCQLESRHWVIYNAQGSQIDTVDGEGVVGLYPLLYPGIEPFAYASCTPYPVPDLSGRVGDTSGGVASPQQQLQQAAAAEGDAAVGGEAGGGAAASAGVGSVPSSTPDAAGSSGGGDAQQQQGGGSVASDNGAGGSSSSSNRSRRWQTGPGQLAGCVVGGMEGSFSFVEGSLMQRHGGGRFDVVCARLVFAVPEYIF